MTTGTIGIIGAGGNLGGSTADGVLDRGWEPARLVAASRSPDKLNHLQERGVRVRRADYDDPATLESALAGVDTALLVPSTAMPSQRVVQLNNAMDAARSAGVRRVATFTLVGTAVDAPFVIMPYLVYAESTLRTSGLEWTILRNSLYADPIAEWLPDIVRIGTIPYPTGDGRCAYVARADSARAAAAMLTSEGHNQRIYDLTGPAAVTTEELCEIVATATGETVAYRPATDNDYVAASVSDDFPEEYARLLVTMYHGIRDGYLAAATDDIEQLTGSPAQDLGSFLAAAWDGRH